MCSLGQTDKRFTGSVMHIKASFLLYGPDNAHVHVCVCFCTHISAWPHVCQSFFICECVHACIVCIYQGGWVLSLKAWCRLKRRSVQRSNDKKEGAEGSQGNLLLPGPCELAWGALSHLVLCLSTCILFAQATVIILMISWLARSPHSRAISTDLTSPYRSHPFIQLEMCWRTAMYAETKRPSPWVEQQSEQTLDPHRDWQLKRAWRSLKQWIPNDMFQPNFYTFIKVGRLSGNRAGWIWDDDMLNDTKAFGLKLRHIKLVNMNPSFSCL